MGGIRETRVSRYPSLHSLTRGDSGERILTTNYRPGSFGRTGCLAQDDWNLMEAPDRH